MERVRKAGEEFDRFALTVAGDDVQAFHALMRGTLRDFLTTAEAWLTKLIRVQEQTKQHGKRWRSK